MPSMGKSEEKCAPQSQNPQFSTWEVMVMERLLHEGKGFVLDENLFRSLSEEFSRVRGRTGAEPQAVQMEDVQRWVLTRRDEVEVEVASSADAGKEFVADSDPSLPKDEPQSSSDASKDTGEKNPELMEFDFEAKSLRDQAWYDVATFLAYRVASVTDEPEVRVRFQGFGAEEDEWVNVKTAVRARSIPLEAFDCRRVVVGDLVLCFRETNAQALYFDAHVLDIKRRVHDIRGCRCLFSVRYDHDNVEDTVTLRRLCRRPEN